MGKKSLIIASFVIPAIIIAIPSLLFYYNFAYFPEKQGPANSESVEVSKKLRVYRGNYEIANFDSQVVKLLQKKGMATQGFKPWIESTWQNSNRFIFLNKIERGKNFQLITINPYLKNNLIVTCQKIEPNNYPSSKLDICYYDSIPDIIPLYFYVPNADSIKFIGFATLKLVK